MVVLPFLVAVLLSAAQASNCGVPEFQECAKNSKWGFKPPNPNTIELFCRSYRFEVAECLAKRLSINVEERGSSFHRGEILLNCSSQASATESEESKLAVLNARFFQLACVHNDIADAHEQPCFDYLMSNCTGNSPPAECFYGDCPPNRRGKVLLSSDRTYNSAPSVRGEKTNGSSGGFGFTAFIALLAMCLML